VTTTKIKAQQRIAKVATAKADELSLKLHHLTKIVRLAAFAAESRRTLQGIENALTFRPEMQEVLAEVVPCINNWAEMEDAVGDVLCYAADQLEEVYSGFTEITAEVSERIKAGGR
jgi:hypothetical protein